MGAEPMIRKMNIKDYDNVYTLWLNTPGMGLNTVDDSREGIAKYLARNPSTCFVWEENGELIGAILSGHDGRRGYICHTAVAKARQKQGIGKSLLSAAMDALEREGISKVTLFVFANNEEGNVFWERHGFNTRTDVLYRSKIIIEVTRIDT
jgi:ribosomal protein S18 acetylase RimI-like enzyme